MPPPNFPMCQNPEKNEVLNWPPPGMTKSKTCHPQIMTQSRTVVSLGMPGSGLCHFLGVASPGLSHSRGWPVQDSDFSGLWHIWKFGGGKKDGPPCIKWSTSNAVLHLCFLFDAMGTKLGVKKVPFTFLFVRIYIFCYIF